MTPYSIDDALAVAAGEHTMDIQGRDRLYLNPSVPRVPRAARAVADGALSLTVPFDQRAAGFACRGNA
jgi:hypothetical protein